MQGQIHLFTIAGIRIEIHISWLIIFVLLTVTLATSWFPLVVPGVPTLVDWVVSGISAILFFASVLAHELAHSLMARLRGLPVKSITLFIFGGVSNIEREPRSPGVEFQMAFVGPLTSLAIGGLTLLAAALLHLVAPAAGGQMLLLAAAGLTYLGVTNLLLGVFNLLPGFPLDGGRVLRSLIWKLSGNLKAATIWAARLGQGVAFLFILFGLWQVFAGDIVDGIWIGFIGWFLLNAAQAESGQVQLESAASGLRVADVMSPPPPSAPATTSVEQLVHDYLLHNGLQAVPVARGEQLIGMITLADVRQIDREQWPHVPVDQVMVPLGRLHAVTQTTALLDAIQQMSEAKIEALPVVQEGRLVGVLTSQSLAQALTLRRVLGAGGSPAGVASQEAASARSSASTVNPS
jgi:Zn-dependent protease/CBS domain-containing protein